MSTYDFVARAREAQTLLDRLDGLLNRLDLHPGIQRLHLHRANAGELLDVMDAMRASALDFRQHLPQFAQMGIQPLALAQQHADWLELALEAVTHGVQQCTDLLLLLQEEGRLHHEPETSTYFN